jgi:F-box/WD-40 domain protein 5
LTKSKFLSFCFGCGFVRYLYVNSRAWPRDCAINDPLNPPPIAQEINVDVIDLTTMSRLDYELQSHKAYTSNDECFFIFLDVSEKYVARFGQFVLFM